MEEQDKMNKIKKLFIKMFMPSAEDIANMATDAVAKFINESGREEAIAKYGTIADEFTKIQSKITGWLKDGKIDEDEKKELHGAILPLAHKLVEDIKS